MKLAIFAETSSTHMRNWSKEMHKRGHTLYWFAFDRDQQLPYVNYIILPKFKPYPYAQFILQAPRVRRILRQRQVDWAHAFYTTNFSLLAALSTKGRYSVTAAGSDILLDPYRQPFFKAINQFSLSRSAFIHSFSEEISQILRSEYRGLPEIVTCPEGIDTAFFSPAAKEQSGKLVIVSTRNFRPVYNMGQQVQAALLLAEAGIPFEYHFIGDGHERPGLETLVQGSRAINSCIFHGRLPRENILQFLQKADIYVSTSISDGTSSSLIEAMACGIFPVVTDIPANRAWVQHGENGFLVPLNDPQALSRAIIEAHENEALRQHAGEQNRHLAVEHADIKNIIERIIQKIESCVATPSV